MVYEVGSDAISCGTGLDCEVNALELLVASGQ